jgi:hypothetical protein
MTYRLQSLPRVMALATLLAVLGAPACWAQVGGPGVTGNGIGPMVNPADAQNANKPAAAPQQLPPALPGAKSDPSKVAPATKQATDMTPTDELFDAINRGDIAAARDSLNRGADLDGHNVLGMTPMELSIDLSRNDIAFLLLSMRGADTVTAPPLATKGGKPGKPIREVRVKVAAPAKVTAPQAPRNARLFAGDGGAAVPSSGFLGFGGGEKN